MLKRFGMSQFVLPQNVFAVHNVHVNNYLGTKPKKNIHFVWSICERFGEQLIHIIFIKFAWKF